MVYMTIVGKLRKKKLKGAITMKKSVKVRIISLVLALTVLGGAVTAAAIMGSPYETLRTAILDAMTMRNVTADMNMSITVNGEIIHEVGLRHIQGDNGSLSFETISSDGIVESDGFVFSNQNMEVTPFNTHGRMGTNAAEGNWYRARVFDGTYRAVNSSPFGMLTPEDRNSSEMRFAELLIDLLVGDMRNNISMTSVNGVRRIRGSISEHQVPEIVRAGIDMVLERTHHNTVATRTEFLSASGTEVISEVISVDYRQGLTYITTWTSPVTLTTLVADESSVPGSSVPGPGMVVFESIHGFRAVEVSDHKDVWIGEIFYFDGDVFVATGPSERSESNRPFIPSDFDGVHPLEIPIQSFVINRVTGEGTVDNDGNLLAFDVGGLFTATNILGQANEIEMNISLQFSDIGTSNPSNPIPGADEILSRRNLQAHLGHRTGSMMVFFTLNDDGTINEESITTMSPMNSSTVRVFEPENVILDMVEEETEYQDETDESTDDASGDEYEYEAGETDEAEDNDADDEGQV